MHAHSSVCLAASRRGLSRARASAYRANGSDDDDSPATQLLNGLRELDAKNRCLHIRECLKWRSRVTWRGMRGIRRRERVMVSRC